MLTFDDLLDHTLAFAGDDVTQDGTAKVRLAVVNAYNLIPTLHDWSYLWALGRVNTVQAQNTGTIQYTAATGTITLSGATWPSWAATGYVVFNNTPYQVQAVTSPTVLTVAPNQISPIDFPAGTPYQIMKDSYDLPADFVGCDEVIINEVGAVLTYQHPRNWSSERRTNTGPGQPWMFTLIGASNEIGVMRMAFWPPPDLNYAVDFLYRRTMRPLRYAKVQQGTLSTDGSTAACTGAGTLFQPRMVGSVVRFSADNQTPPTGSAGGNPADFETTITAVNSTTSLALAAVPPAYAGVAYSVTDPVDVDLVVMGEFVLRECEYQFRKVSREQPTKTEVQDYTLAIERAREADNRNTSRQAALRKQSRRSGFIHYPINFTG